MVRKNCLKAFIAFALLAMFALSCQQVTEKNSETDSNSSGGSGTSDNNTKYINNVKIKVTNLPDEVKALSLWGSPNDWALVNIESNNNTYIVDVIDETAEFLLDKVDISAPLCCQFVPMTSRYMEMSDSTWWQTSFCGSSLYENAQNNLVYDWANGAKNGITLTLDIKATYGDVSNVFTTRFTTENYLNAFVYGNGDGNTNTPQDEDVNESFYGIYEDEETGLVYEINENGTYTIRQCGILLESGSFDESDDAGRSLSRTTRVPARKKTIVQKPKVSAGAKKSTAKPAPAKVPVKKTTTSSGTKTYIGNTNVAPKTSSSSSSTSKPSSGTSSSTSKPSANKLKNIGIYVRSKKVPVIKYFPDSDIYSNDMTTAKLKVRSRSTNQYYWYYAKIDKVINVTYSIYIDGLRFTTKEFETQTLYFDTQTQNWNGTPEKPANFRSVVIDDDDEAYNGRNNLYYVRGSFEAEGDQWLATDGWNNMTEIAENIFSCTLYLPQNIYGFKIATDDWEHDFCVPFDYTGFVPKNEWFDTVKSYYSEWHGKNMALSTGGGLYTFSLDITDEAHPQLLISTDEVDDSAIDDGALYAVGAFNGWKFNENGAMKETYDGSGIWKATVTIPNDYTEEEPCEFGISDKTWGGIVDGFGWRWWLGQPILEEGVPTPIDGAYIYCRDPDAPTGSTNNLSYPFTAGTWSISLNIAHSVAFLTIHKL